MSGIKGKNTGPEKLIRSGLHQAGFRFALHRRDLPGKPDIVLPKYKAVVLVHGCFWHGHHCPLFKVPKTRTEFWLNKIDGNRRRDAQNIAALLNMKWRVLVVWECAVRLNRRSGLQVARPITKIVEWLISRKKTGDIAARRVR